MIKEIIYKDKTIKVHTKNATETTQQSWNNGLFYNRSVLSFIENIYVNGSIIEIGASIGNNTLFFGGVLGAFVHCIEPDEIKRAQLSKNIMLNDIRTNLLPYAVSDYAGLARIERGERLVYIKDNRDIANVRVTTVDTVIFDVVTIMYIDVKENEFNILAGCRRTIKTYTPHIFIRTERPYEVASFLTEKFKVKYEVKYQFNEKKSIYYLKANESKG